jgi:hypothetical protein
MSDWPIDRRTLTTLTAYRTSLLSTIGHLRGIKEDTAQPCTRHSKSPHTSCGMVPSDTQGCEGCHGTGHNYTECRNHTYCTSGIYLSTNSRLLTPGKHLSGPATWLNIHRTSLHHLLCTVLHWYPPHTCSRH